MYCPNCLSKNKNPITMAPLTYIYSWKDKKPLWYDEYYRCPICNTEVGIKLPVIHYKEGKSNDSK